MMEAATKPDPVTGEEIPAADDEQVAGLETPPAQPEPEGTVEAPRNYRILLLDQAEGEELPEQLIWLDCGYYPGSNEDAAVNRAKKDHPEVTRKDRIRVAIPEAYFRPTENVVKMVETVGSERVDI
jgi:hypothetical protein